MHLFSGAITKLKNTTGLDLDEFAAQLRDDTSALSQDVREATDKMHLKEHVAQATRLGQQVISNTATIIDKIGTPLEEGAAGSSAAGAPRAAAAYTRRQERLRALRSDPATFTDEPPQPEDFAAWAAGFSLLDASEDIQAVLRESPEAHALHARLVPVEVPYRRFWERYFYRAYLLAQEEARRAEAVERASRARAEDSLDLGWDEGEEEDGLVVAAPAAAVKVLPAAGDGWDEDGDEVVLQGAAGPAAAAPAGDAPGEGAGRQALAGTREGPAEEAPAAAGLDASRGPGAGKAAAPGPDARAARPVAEEAGPSAARPPRAPGDAVPKAPPPAAASASGEDGADVISMSSVAASSLSYQLVGTSEAVRAPPTARGGGYASHARLGLASSPCVPCPLLAQQGSEVLDRGDGATDAAAHRFPEMAAERRSAQSPGSSLHEGGSGRTEESAPAGRDVPVVTEAADEGDDDWGNWA